MQHRGIKTFLSLLFFVLTVAMLMAQTNGAMLYTKGNVTLNGQSVPSSTSIFVGDRLEVADASVGSINRNGSSVVLSPNSSMQYQQSGVALLKGTARISASQGMSTQAGQFTITPQSGAAKFEVVTLSSNSVLVTSREGALSVNSGSSAFTLQPGDQRVFGTGTDPMDAGTRKSAMTNQAVSAPFYTVGQNHGDQGLPPCASYMFCNRPHSSQFTPCMCPAGP
jgi:hypothetical protein